jgi:hypothetical protein
MAMNARFLRATPGRLGRLILRRLFDRPHAQRRPHVSLAGQPSAQEAGNRGILPLVREGRGPR